MTNSRLNPGQNIPLRFLDIPPCLYLNRYMSWFTGLKTPLFTILLLFVGLFLYTRLFGPIPFSVNSITTTKTTFFTVQGTGKKTAVPDTAMLSLGITKSAPTIAEAQNEVNTVVTKLTRDLKALGIEEKNIKTTNYSVNPDYIYPTFGGSPSANSYTVTASIEVRVKPVDTANKAIDAATKDGANLVGGATFVLDDDAQIKLTDEARKEAIDNAKQKAEKIASQTDVSLGRIVDVKENTGGFYPGSTMMNAQKADATVPTQLNPGENTIQITVTLSYELR